MERTPLHFLQQFLILWLTGRGLHNNLESIYIGGCFASRVSSRTWTGSVPPRRSGLVNHPDSKSIGISHANHLPTRYRVAVLTRPNSDFFLCGNALVVCFHDRLQIESCCHGQRISNNLILTDLKWHQSLVLRYVESVRSLL